MRLKRLGLIKHIHSETQKDLAEKMGVSQQLISRIESGNENASLETLSNIAKVFNKEVDVTFI